MRFCTFEKNQKQLACSNAEAMVLSEMVGGAAADDSDVVDAVAGAV
jgi:hypothetical protein